jgi:hypothetical protein
LCEYCEKEIDLRKKIKAFMEEEMYDIQENYDLSKMKNDFLENALMTKRQIDALMPINQELRPQLETDLSKYKEIVEILKDYEVKIN